MVLLGAVAALGSLSVHLFVPAMPGVAASLHASRPAVQLALTLYLIGLASGQLASGALADRIGRRRVLVGGGAVFVAGSILCCVAGSIAAFLLGRVLQALGASGGLVAGRAIAGDDADGRGARDMALLTAIVLLSPMLAPVLGSVIAQTAGWRAIFAILTITGLSCTLVAARRLADPFAPVAARAGFVTDWARLVRDRQFLRPLAVGSALSGGLYVFLASSPFLLVDIYGVPPARLGVMFGLVALGAGGGALTASRLAGRRSATELMRAGTAVSALAAVLLVAGTLAGLHRVEAFLLPMALFAWGGGIVAPNAMIGVVGGASGRIGTAVSLYGTLQMLGSAAATALAASLPLHDPVPPTLVIAALGVAAATVQWWCGTFGPIRGPAVRGGRGDTRVNCGQ